ncbi:MAG TPA: hypothetical protein VNA15_08445, partial [Candidatus Angelobacter sp.]|nr:hypothetical protein [Candidatus Angelobacter sp.]
RKTKIATIILVLGASLISFGVFELRAHAIGCLLVFPVDQKFGKIITAAVIATPAGVTGPVNAGGVCDVGVYVGPSASGATITATVTDALQVGIFNDGANGVTVSGTVSCTGNHSNLALAPCTNFSPNGVQTGIGVYFSCTGTGTISGSTINQYQKGGIVARDLDSVHIRNNDVTGLGPFELIAQNGIELGFSSTCGPTLSTSNVDHVTGNTVTGNIYTQGAEKGVISTGILGEANARPIGPLVSALETSNRISQNQGDTIVIVG